MADLTQYVTLGIAGEVLAVPVDTVREILENRTVSRLPHAPDYLLGMLDVRGQGVPVIDLRLKLGFPTAPDTENTRIIVLTVTVDDRVLTLGLKTDRVFEVTVLDDTALEPPPDIGVRWSSNLIVGIGRRNGTFATVLNLDRLFAASEAKLLIRPTQSSDEAA